MHEKKSDYGTSLQPLTAASIVDSLQSILQRLGDFSAYIGRVSDQDEVTINTFTHRSACVTLPTMTLARQGVDEERLSRATRVVELLNKAIARGEPFHYRLMQAACVTPPHWRVDKARTAAVAHEPPPTVDPHGPTTLPRLTPEAIKALADALLQAYGDLSVYVSEGPEGQVQLKIFSPKSSSELPAPTPHGHAVGKDGVGAVTNAVRKLNAAFLSGETTFEFGELHV